MLAASGITYTLLATKSELTKMLPFSPWRRPRASSTPEAQTSALKPGGSLNLVTGSWSAGVGTGNAGTGAIFMASSVFGRPLAQPGSSWAGLADAAPTAHSAPSAISERLLTGSVASCVSFSLGGIRRTKGMKATSGHSSGPSPCIGPHLVWSLAGPRAMS